MASVWAAEDQSLGRLVAIKIPSDRLVGDSDGRRRFEREARAAAALSSHPHVVTIYDVDERDGHPFIVMEHFSGGTVSDAIKHGQVDRERALRWLAEAASALDAAHERGVTHRDVKPGNLMLDGRGRLAVGDFGIARQELDDTMTLPGTVIGTAAYISPEQADGRSATAASDRYALGVVAYELLTGRRPFEGDQVAAQARAHIEDEPPPASTRRPGLPRALDPVLARALAKDPAQRWPSAAAMVAALREALGEAGAEAAAVEQTAPTHEMGAGIAKAGAGAGAGAGLAALGAAADSGASGAAARARSPRAPRPAAAAAGAEPAGFKALGPRRRRAFAIPAVIVLAAAGVVLAVILGGGGGDTGPKATTSAKRPASTARHTTSSASSTPATPAQTTPTQPSTASSTPSTTASTGSSDPSSLNARGLALSQQGSYDQAIAMLRQATSNCPVSQTDPCAFALFNLGHALRLAGRPGEAIPVLEQRLANPDQRGTVQHELDAARAEAAAQGGSTSAGPAAGAGKPGKAKGHDKKPKGGG